MYRIHPALPGYLAAAWSAENPGGYRREREAYERALCAACAGFSTMLTFQISSGDVASAYRVIESQRRTLSAMLDYALAHRAWEDARRIVSTLDRYWDTRGLTADAFAWADRILEATGGLDQVPPESARDLWLHTIITQATREKDAGRPEQAAEAYRRVLAYLETQPTSRDIRGYMAHMYHALGMTAQDGRRLDEAEDWYRKSLVISEEVGNRSGAASTYNQLGIVAQMRGRLDEAEEWYRRSLASSEKDGKAISYHQRGMAAKDHGRLDEAEDLFHQSLAISKRVGDLHGIALTYHELGGIELGRSRLGKAKDSHLDKARDWYSKSLDISEKVGDKPTLASTYQQLGNIAADRGQLEEAEDWYLRSLAISEGLGDKAAMALAYGNLAVLTLNREPPRSLDWTDQQAAVILDWTIKSVALFEEVPHPAAEVGAARLAWICDRSGLPLLEDAWLRVTGQPLPRQVRRYLTRPFR